MTASYREFLAAKTQITGADGFDPVWSPDFLFGFQRHLVDWSTRMGRAAVFADCGLGKAQPSDEVVLTPTGWRSIGSLSVGDRIIAHDGTPARVVGVYPQGRRPTYVVRFSDGAHVRCDEEHLWAVRSDNHEKRGQPWKVLSAAELRQGPLRYDRRDDIGTYSWRVPMCGPVEHPEIGLPIDPYILGVLLGDGCLTQPDVTFTVADDGIAQMVSARLPSSARLVRIPDHARPRTPTYRISTNEVGYGLRNEILDALRSLGLMGRYSYEKHVPAAYLTASAADRLDLLRGLLDTDGEASRSYVQFCTTSAALASAVTDLTRSLGGTARTSTKVPHYTHNGERRTGRTAYLVTIRLPLDVVPFALDRKADRYTTRKRLAPIRKIVAIEPADQAECVCIAIDHPSQLYITRDYVVTHNTPVQLAWAENVRRHTGRPVLVVTPLAVSFQTEAEAAKFGIDATTSRDGRITAGITVTNYERLENFDPAAFGGVVCDESSAIKAFDGRRRAIVTEFLRTHRYRLLCTATAAPNDYIELGTSSEALGYLGHMDMLNRFFTNKQGTSATGRGFLGQDAGWRFKGHAEQPFWRWVASWARAARKPSDLGYDDTGFALPPLEHRRHIIQARSTQDGALFDVAARGLREERDEARRTIAERCEAAAELLADADSAVAWCQLNAEGDLLTRLIDGAVQVSGSDSPDAKEETLAAFSRGEIRVLVTKPVIGAWGLNWQHCHRMAYFPSHSYEQYYQAVRRSWRYGQRHPVLVDVITTDGGANVFRNLERKAAQADRMFDALTAHMRDALSIRRSDTYEQSVEVPAWAAS